MLPTAAWGTTAGAAQTIKQLFKGAALQSKKSVSAGDDITRIENAKAIQVTKESINPDDIHIEKIRPNAVTSQTDIFQVKFISSNGSEVKFNLEIPSELLEKKRLETEKIIQDLLEVGELEMEEVDRVRKNWSLLSEIQQVVSRMSEESFKKGDSITFDELHSMADSQFKDRAFKKILQNYSRHSNSKLSSIGVENVQIEQMEKSQFYPFHTHMPKHNIYKIGFKTQRGKKLSLELAIPKDMESDKRISFDDLATMRDDISDVLSLKQKLQIAIGQMPAESFKGLKSIRLSNFASEVKDFSGAIKPHQVAPVRSTVSRGKIVENYWFYKIHPRLIINKSVVDTYLKITKQTPTDMILVNKRFEDIPSPLGKDLTSTLSHELGHVLAYSRFGSPDPGRTWKEAVKKDGTSVSKYGDTRIEEDFAEAMKVFIQTDGGTKNPKAMEDFAHRFEILGNLMRTSMQERKSIFDRFRKRMEEKGIGFIVSAGMLTHVVMKDHVYIIHPSEDTSENI